MTGPAGLTEADIARWRSFIAMDEQAGIAWWNGLSERARSEWLRIAQSARPVDAWLAYQRTHAAKPPASTQ